MSDKVVSLTGSPIPRPGAPSERLIEWMEAMLERAKAGEVIGFAGAALHADKAATFHIVGFTGGFSMLGAMDCAHRRLVEIADG